MTVKRVHGRILSGGLMAMLLPAGAILAQSRIEPGFDLCSVEQARETGPRSAATHHQLPILAGGLFRAGGPEGVLTFGELLEASPIEVGPATGAAPESLGSTDASAPWFRSTFVMFRNGGTCLVAPVDGAPSSERSEQAHLARPEGQLPGTVKNLRRADPR